MCVCGYQDMNPRPALRIESITSTQPSNLAQSFPVLLNKHFPGDKHNFCPNIGEMQTHLT